MLCETSSQVLWPLFKKPAVSVFLDLLKLLYQIITPYQTYSEIETSKNYYCELSKVTPKPSSSKARTKAYKRMAQKRLNGILTEKLNCFLVKSAQYAIPLFRLAITMLKKRLFNLSTIIHISSIIIIK